MNISTATQAPELALIIRLGGPESSRSSSSRAESSRTGSNLQSRPISETVPSFEILMLSSFLGDGLRHQQVLGIPIKVFGDESAGLPGQTKS
jgi:hypothetical protein